jgi:hypothetical protein
MPNILKSMVVVLLLMASDFETDDGWYKFIPSAATSLDKTRAGVFNNLLFVRTAEQP